MYTIHARVQAISVLHLMHKLYVTFCPLYSLDDSGITINGTYKLAKALKVNQSLQILRSVAE